MPGSQRVARFTPEPESVGDARRFVQSVLAEWGLDAVEPEVSILVTELTTNSVLHSRTDFVVTMSMTGTTLRLSVADGSPRLPAPKSYSRRATTGRGLQLVTSYADAWGVTPEDAGKSVWCVVRVGVVRAAGWSASEERDAPTGRSLDAPCPGAPTPTSARCTAAGRRAA